MAKHRGGVYSMMMLIAFAALLTSTLLLYFELTQWGTYPWWR